MQVTGRNQDQELSRVLATTPSAYSPCLVYCHGCLSATLSHFGFPSSLSLVGWYLSERSLIQHESV